MSAMVTSDVIFDQPRTPVPWPETHPVMEFATVLLLTVASAVMSGLVERLMLAVVCLREELQATRTTCSASLELSHALHIENVRLKKRVAELLDARRQELTGGRSSPAGPSPGTGTSARAIQAFNKNTNSNSNTNDNDRFKAEASTRQEPVQAQGQVTWT